MMLTVRAPLGVIAGLLSALMFLAAGGCENSTPGRAEVTVTAQPAPQIVRQANGPVLLDLQGGTVPGMTVAEVREAELPTVLETTGQVAFDDRRVASIVARVGGRIENTRVSQWDNVRRGEPIVELYSPDLMTDEAEYLQAQTTAKLSSSPSVGGNGGLAAEMVSAARRKLELLGMSDADIAAIHAPSPSVWIRAPISGTVLETRAVRGAAVNPGDVLYTVGTLDQVWIIGNVYEDDLARIHEGQPLDAVTTAYPAQSFHGFISRISPDVNPDTHTVQIRCEVANPGLELKPQMMARIRIVTRASNALVVPQEALVFDTNRYYAFVEVGAGRFERRAVDIGSWKEQGYARVIAGLRPGERVVVAESIQVNALWHEANGESS